MYSTDQYRSGFTRDGEIRTPRSPGKVRLRWPTRTKAASPLKIRQMTKKERKSCFQK